MVRRLDTESSDEISGEDLASVVASLEPDQLISTRKNIIVRVASLRRRK